MAAEIFTQPPPLPSPEVIRQTASEVIQRPDYVFEPGADLSFIVRFIESVVRALMRMFERMYDISPFLAWFVVVFLFLTALGLFVHVIYTLRAALQGHRRSVGIGETGEEGAEEPERWEEKARAAAAAGDYIGAVRCLLRAGLLCLESARKRTVRRGQTNREYLRGFRETPAFEPLRRLVEVVDYKWYAGADCSPQDYEGGAQAYAEIRRAARALAAAQEKALHAHRA